jgi:hypothetical protein
MSDTRLHDYYYDPRTGFKSAKEMHKNFPDVPLKEIKSFLSKQEVNQLHGKKHQVKYYPIFGEAGSYQADLTFYDQYKKQNGNYSIILTVIEVNSRKAYARALKNKSMPTVIDAFKEIMTEAKKHLPMKVVSTDQGSEFKKAFTDFLEVHDIEHLLADANDHKRQGMVERFNRTLRDKLERYFTSHNTHKWVDVLDDVMYNYNDSTHSTTGFKPDNVGEKELEIIRKQQKQRVREAEEADDIVRIGEKVRRIKPKHILEKKTGERYYRGVYTVSRINAFSYRVSNEAGELLKERFKRYQLQRVDGSDTYEGKDKEFDREVAVKEHKVEKVLKQEGIDESNVVESKRARTSVTKYSS